MTSGPGPSLAPSSAATLVLLRPSSQAGGSLEVLLTRRPDTMRFGPGMHVFPGGRLEAGESAAEAAIRETAEETGIEVDLATVVPMTRWVTPYGLPARFDARFFGAIVAPGTDVRHASPEVADWAWLRPTAALEGMASGRLAMWQPTVVTLQQLEPIGDEGGLRAAFASDATRAEDARTPDPSGANERRSVATAWAAGIEGRTGHTRVMGRREWVAVSPGDPTAGTLEAVLAAADRAAARLAGVVIEDLRPDHHAGVEMFARGLGLPVAGPPGADGHAPYRVVELGEGDRVPFGDVDLRVTATTPPSAAPRVWSERAGTLVLEAG